MKCEILKAKENKGIIDSPYNYIMFDIETTGLDAENDEIIELSAIKVINGIPFQSFDTLIKPTNPIPAFITKINGITNKMVKDSPEIIKVLPEFCSFIEDLPVLGYKVDFDASFINSQLMKYFGKQFGNQVLDVLEVAQSAIPELHNHKLGTVSNYLGLDTEGTHRALKDCELTNECYNHCKEILKERGVKLSFLRPFTPKKLSRSSKSPAKAWINFAGQPTAKDIKPENTNFNEAHPLYSKVCVFTGDLESFTREDAMQAVVNIGGLCGSGITKKTNYLIVGSFESIFTVKGDKSSKIIKAEKYKLEGIDIEIISENTFFNLLKG